MEISFALTVRWWLIPRDHSEHIILKFSISFPPIKLVFPVSYTPSAFPTHSTLHTTIKKIKPICFLIVSHHQTVFFPKTNASLRLSDCWGFEKNTQTASVWKTTNTTYWMTFPWGPEVFELSLRILRWFARACVCMFVQMKLKLFNGPHTSSAKWGGSEHKKKIFLCLGMFVLFFLGMPSRSCSSYHIAFILSYNRIIRAALRLWNRYEITLITFEFIGSFFLFLVVWKLLSLSHSRPLVHIPFCRVISFHFFRLLCAIHCPSSISFACYSLEMMNEGCSEWEMKTWSFPEPEKNGRVKKM